jgi:hypothetical protein
LYSPGTILPAFLITGCHQNAYGLFRSGKIKNPFYTMDADETANQLQKAANSAKFKQHNIFSAANSYEKRNDQPK